jgi:hypothetical protein
MCILVIHTGHCCQQKWRIEMHAFVWCLHRCFTSYLHGIEIVLLWLELVFDFLFTRNNVRAVHEYAWWFAFDRVVAGCIGQVPATALHLSYKKSLFAITFISKNSILSLTQEHVIDLHRADGVPQHSRGKHTNPVKSVFLVLFDLLFNGRRLLCVSFKQA